MKKTEKRKSEVKKTSDKYGLNIILRPTIILIIISGAFVPSFGPFDIGNLYFIIYFILTVYYLVRLSRASLSKKPEIRKNRLWYLIILIIIYIPMREPIQSMRIKSIKDFVIKMHEDCNKQKKCPEVKSLPFTNGRFISPKLTDSGFEISHWHMETVHKFKGGIGQDLTFSYSWADHFDKKESIYKYDNKEWIKINDGYFN